MTAFHGAYVAAFFLGLTGCELLIDIERRTERASDAGVAAADAQEGSAGDALPDTPTIDPKTLGPLELWLDGDRDVTIADGQVRRWGDQSGKRRDLAREGPEVSPIRADPFPGTGRQAVRFAPPDPAAASVLSNRDFSVPQPFTVAFAMHPMERESLYDSPFGGSNSPAIAIKRLGSAVQAVAGTATSGLLQVSDAWTVAPHVVVAVYDGASSSLQVDALPVTTGNLPGAPLEGAVLSQSAAGYHGYIGELLVYGRALPEAERGAIADYLRTRFIR